MSIYENTEALEEVLEMARSLPDASGGGSSADLVIRVNQHCSAKPDVGDIEIIKGDILSVCESIKSNNEKCIKVEVHNYDYNESGGFYDVTCSVVGGTAYFYGGWFYVYYLLQYGTVIYGNTIEWSVDSGEVNSITRYKYTGTAV